MPLNDDKVRVSARINRDLYDNVLKINDNFTQALIKALTAFVEKPDKESQTNKDNIKTEDDSEKIDLIKGQLDIMTAQVEYLKGQIVIKDQQIEKQAFSLQSVIQENSRLNLRLLPESQETKTQEQKLTRWQHLKGFVFGTQ